MAGNLCSRRQDRASEELKNQSPGAGAKRSKEEAGGCSGISTCRAQAVVMMGPVLGQWRALEDCQQERT